MACWPGLRYVARTTSSNTYAISPYFLFALSGKVKNYWSTVVFSLEIFQYQYHKYFSYRKNKLLCTIAQSVINQYHM